VYGWASATSGITKGVTGVSDSVSGYGGYFVNANQTCTIPPPEIYSAYGGAAERSVGCGVGVYGEAAIGVKGYGTVSHGVYGESDNIGVEGQGSNYGVVGQGGDTGVGGYTDSSGPWDAGVVGGATAHSGETHGVYGFTNSSTNLAAGVYGNAGAFSGDTFGVYGSNSSTSGVAVFGRATATSGTRRGVRGSVAGSGYGLYTEDELYVGGSCTGCLMTFIARNTSGETLRVGDVLAASDVGPILQGHTTPVIQVRRATADDASVLGVVYLRGEFYAAGDDSPEEDGDIVQPVEGDVAPGDYLLVVTSGLTQVRVGPASKGIAPGQSLTVGDIAGLATLSETDARPGLVFGRAMEAQADENGLLWAMIATQ
jgi:hypothetical protein